MGRIVRVFAVLFLLVALVVAIGWAISEGIGGALHSRGDVASRPIPPEGVEARRLAQTGTQPEDSDTNQILFGDLHVHTTFSADAFIFSLPMIQGEGSHPPADACDFARFCAELDFFSLNDHAEYLTARQWDETKQAVRDCNAVAGSVLDPDLVAFLGWEWTQSVGPAPSDRTHYGHKNVILLDTAEDEVPARPIGAGEGGLFRTDLAPGVVWAMMRAGMAVPDLPDLEPYLDFNRWVREVRQTEVCTPGVPVRELPPDCLEGAATPDVLFGKLDDWDFESLVIPHGTSWGIHAPEDATLADQLEPGMHDPARQRLFEVYSGHGNSERYAELLEYTQDDDGTRECAAPREGYIPCCWRGGEIMRERCEAEGEPAEECERRAALTRSYMAEVPGNRRYDVVPGATSKDWRECGQLPDGFLPAYEYRPRMSAQYGLAVRGFGGGKEPVGFRYGLVGSSDNHKARAGAGYKEIGRKAFGDAWGLSDTWASLTETEVELRSVPVPPDELPLMAAGPDRNASYYYTAGLVAAHTTGRSREEIWEALRDRQVYGTSGDRILLWFDLLNGPDGGTHPMGSEVALAESPRFRVRALGAFEQKPGCPPHTRDRLSPERLARLCLNECYHPSDLRKRVDRIEVVRIRPQIRADEEVGPLIEDPWKVLECPAGRNGCQVQFEDPEFRRGQREFVYYVRAIQDPSPAVNGDPMRCTRDEDGVCVEATPCPASGPDFDPDDECLSMVEERAWSSPIFVRSAS